MGRFGIAICVGCWLSLAAAPARAQKPELVAPTQVAAEPVPYPEGAQGAAEVVLELVIAQDGSVSDVSVREGSEPFASARSFPTDKKRRTAKNTGSISTSSGTVNKATRPRW